MTGLNWGDRERSDEVGVGNRFTFWCSFWGAEKVEGNPLGDFAESPSEPLE